MQKLLGVHLRYLFSSSSLTFDTVENDGTTIIQEHR